MRANSNLTASAREKNGACLVPSPRAPNRATALNRPARGEGMKGSGVLKIELIPKKRRGFSVPHSPCIPSPRGRSYSAIEPVAPRGEGTDPGTLSEAERRNERRVRDVNLAQLERRDIVDFPGEVRMELQEGLGERPKTRSDVSGSVYLVRRSARENPLRRGAGPGLHLLSARVNRADGGRSCVANEYPDK
jgi:hypothetical protein